MALNRIVVLVGGVGGAKLAHGLAQIVKPENLTIVVNTGDDFWHYGLRVCPDLDTVFYTLSGLVDPVNGWGVAEDTTTTLESLRRYGEDGWFRLGDRDLALHLRRTEWLRQGISLSEVTDRLRRGFGIPSTVLPMCDEPVRTLVHTDEGDLPFQHYFVRRRCEPLLIDLSYVGAEEARVPDAVHEAIRAAQVIVFCPSNPYLSLDPILSVPSMRRLLRDARAWKIAVTPIVGGEAIKGPAAKMMREMGQMISPLTVVDHFADLLDAFVLDNADAVLHDAVQLPTLITDTIMADLESKRRLAQEVLDFVAGLDGSGNLPATPPDARLPASS